jgi:tetratricopeptide (TPR) repeat protein
MFGSKEVAKLAGISAKQVGYWSRTGLVPVAGLEAGRLEYDFRGLVAFRAIRALMDRGFSTRQIRRRLEKLRRTLPEVEQPLTQLRLTVRNGRLVAVRDRKKITADGQFVIDFETPPEPKVLEIAQVDNLFYRGLECEEEARFDEAEVLYRKVLARQPDHADSLVNLGNLHYRRGEDREAEACYRRALETDPDQPEAWFNLANLMDESGEPLQAAAHYRKALEIDPRFADAHFNLALLLEAMNRPDEAKNHFRQYLESAPDDEWKEFVRERLNED